MFRRTAAISSSAVSPCWSAKTFGGPVRLLSKFTLIFACVFAAGLAVVGYVAHSFLQQDAKREVMQQARLMLETARAARNYTEMQVAPLLETTKEHSRTF